MLVSSNQLDSTVEMHSSL